MIDVDVDLPHTNWFFVKSLVWHVEGRKIIEALSSFSEMTSLEMGWGMSADELDELALKLNHSKIKSIELRLPSASGEQEKDITAFYRKLKNVEMRAKGSIVQDFSAFHYTRRIFKNGVWSVETFSDR